MPLTRPASMTDIRTETATTPVNVHATFAPQELPSHPHPHPHPHFQAQHDSHHDATSTHHEVHPRRRRNSMLRTMIDSSSEVMNNLALFTFLKGFVVLFVVSFAFANAHLWWLPSSLQISDSTLVHLAQALLLAICGAALMRIQMIRFMNQLHTELVSASPQASRAYSKCFLKPTFTLLRNLIRALPMYIPMNGLDEIAAGSMVPQDVNLTTCHASVLFLDIVDYTKLIHSQSSSEDVKWVLHRVCEAFGKFADCVVENGGVVSCFMGDGMMCYFPSQSPSHILSDANKNRSCEERACAVALGCLQALEELCTKRWHCCLFRVRIGMSAGECYQGNFGAAGHRLSYTVVSDAVNRAARLESLAKPYGVTIAADETIAEKATKLNWKLLGTDVLRGRSTESRIYSIATN